MDPEQLQNCLRSNIGELTFEESFERSGRSVNITVSPHHHQKARLLNRYTSPYLLMWECLPGVLLRAEHIPAHNAYEKNLLEVRSANTCPA